MNKPYIHYLLKANTDLGMKLKMFINSGCSYGTDFMSKKAKSNVYLLLLSLSTNFI